MTRDTFERDVTARIEEVRRSFPNAPFERDSYRLGALVECVLQISEENTDLRQRVAELERLLGCGP